MPPYAPNYVRIAFITRKRDALRRNSAQLIAALAAPNPDPYEMKLRLDRLTELLREYEEFHDDLERLDPDNEGLTELDDIQNEYYGVAAQVERLSNHNVNSQNRASSTSEQTANAIAVAKRKLQKLPPMPLPHFDGDYNEWLSFSSKFLNRFDTDPLLDDVDKLEFLMNSCHGEAKERIKHFDIISENYKPAWDLLKETYEKKRILISNHIDALLKISTPENVTPQSLSQLTTIVTQNLSSLKALGVEPEPRFIIRILENALPKKIREEWEKTLDLDDLPTLDDFKKFINQTVYRMQSCNPTQVKSQANPNNKRSKPLDSQDSQSKKFRKGQNGDRVFLSAPPSTPPTNSKPTVSCHHCAQDHPIYKCNDFGALTTGQRWAVVNEKGLCKNCLRKHSGHCKSSKCKKCNRFHHTLLHANKNPRAPPNDKAANTSPKAEGDAVAAVPNANQKPKQ